MKIQTIDLKVLFLLCIFSFTAKFSLAEHNFASTNSQEQKETNILERSDVQKVIHQLSRKLRLDPKNKTARENFNAIVAHSGLTSQQRSKLFLIEDLFAYIENLKNRIRYLISKRDLLERQIIERGYDKEFFFQDLLDIKYNMLHSQKPIADQEKPLFEVNDPMEYVNRILINKKEKLFVQVQYLQKQYHWLVQIGNEQLQSSSQHLDRTPQIAVHPLFDDSIGKENSDHSIVILENVSIGDDPLLSDLKEDLLLFEPDFFQPEIMAETIFVHPKTYDEDLADEGDSSEIDKEPDFYQADFEELKENLKYKDDKIDELSEQIIDLSLRMSEIEMTLIEKVDVVAVLNTEVTDIEQRFMLEQRIIQEKDAEIQSLQDSLDRFRLGSNEQKDNEVGVGYLKNQQLKIQESLNDANMRLLERDKELREINGILSIYKGKLVDSSRIIKVKDKQVEFLSHELTKLQKEIALKKNVFGQDDFRVRVLKEALLWEKEKRDQRNSNLRKVVYERDLQIDKLKERLLRTEDNLDLAKKMIQQKVMRVNQIKGELVLLHLQMASDRRDMRELTSEN